LPSGVYRFKLAELGTGKTLQLTPGGADPHLIAKFTTKNKDWPVGANGMGFAKDGTMYVCNFGDAQILKFAMKDGAPTGPPAVLAEGHGMLSTDGMKVCPKTGDIYVADFLGNAVHKVDPKTGEVATVHKNALSTGAGGALDKCSEVCLRDGKLYVANIDLALDGNKFDKPYTISVIDLGK
jgi:sugar lactone lactonase YvrE